MLRLSSVPFRMSTSGRLSEVARKKGMVLKARTVSTQYSVSFSVACASSIAAIFHLKKDQTKCDTAVQKRKEKRESISISRHKKRRSRRFMKRLRRKFLRWIAMFLRSIYLSLVFAPAALTLPIALLQGLDEDGDNGKKSYWWWSILKNCIRNSGPCTIKFSQWVATRQDSLPKCVICKNFNALF